MKDSDNCPHSQQLPIHLPLTQKPPPPLTGEGKDTPRQKHRTRLYHHIYVSPWLPPRRYTSQLVIRLFGFLSRPNNPNQHNYQLQYTSRPQRARDTNPGAREQPTSHGTKQQHEWRAQPPVPLGVVQPEQLGVTKQVAVDARQHNARQCVVPQGAAGHGLAARLEGHEGNGHEDVPGDVADAVVAGTEGHDGGGGDAEDGLEHEAADEGAASLGAEVAVEAAEEERADAEEAEGSARLDPPRALRGCREAKADVHGVACGA